MQYKPLSIIALCAASSAVGQITFEQTYGGVDGDIGFSVEQTSDGGYALFGSTWNGTAGSADMYLIKTDAAGMEQWSHNYGSVDMDMGYCARQTSNGGYILCGMFGTFGTDTLTLVRTDANGTALWIERYPGSLGRDIGYSVEETSDGGFLVCGFTEGTGVEEDVYVLRTTGNGALLWATSVDLGASEVGWCLRRTDDDGCIVVANSFDYGDPNGEIHLLRFDPNGDTLWTSTILTPGADESRGLAITLDGGFIVAGGNGSPYRDILLVRTDEFGIEQWRRTYATAGDEAARDVQQMDDGGFIVGGRKEDLLTNDIQMHLMRTDADGYMEWERTFQQGIFSDANSLDRTSDGGFVLFGHTTDTLGGVPHTDMYLVKTDGAGYSTVASIADPGGPILVYPNPAADRILLDAGKTRLTSAVLFDAAGKQVLRETFSATTTAELSLGHLYCGAYVLNATAENGRSTSQALLIVR